ncbi:hypothetical protein DL96DRAFT_557398 [Flagelloscypha sp. PMI_526]|nr:hypothetical protein DL96DRAFT_557398 [Flagelloscypha sp. PMI_526]
MIILGSSKQPHDCFQSPPPLSSSSNSKPNCSPSMVDLYSPPLPLPPSGLERHALMMGCGPPLWALFYHLCHRSERNTWTKITLSFVYEPEHAASTGTTYTRSERLTCFSRFYKVTHKTRALEPFIIYPSSCSHSSHFFLYCALSCYIPPASPTGYGHHDSLALIRITEV